MQPRPHSQSNAVLEVDHARYLNERSYRRRVHAGYRRIAHKPGLLVQNVLHEADGRCCAAEPWSWTALRIQKALADDGLRAAWVFASNEEAT